jgi:hypothetical protein
MVLIAVFLNSGVVLSRDSTVFIKRNIKQLRFSTITYLLNLKYSYALNFKKNKSFFNRE